MFSLRILVGVTSLLLAVASQADDLADAVSARDLKLSGSEVILPTEETFASAVDRLRGYQSKLRDFSKERDRIDKEAQKDAATLDALVSRYRALDKKEESTEDFFETSDLWKEMKKVREQIDVLRERQSGPVKVARQNVVIARRQCLDAIRGLRADADKILARYEELKADDELVDAIKAASQNKPVSLGPGRKFSKAAKDLEKAESKIVWDEIPAKWGGESVSIDAVIDGKTTSIEADPNLALVVLASRTAFELKVTPSPDAPTIEVQQKSGRWMKGRKHVLKDVRLGRFIAQKVPCVVLNPEYTDAKSAIGANVLNEFVRFPDRSKNRIILACLPDSTSPVMPVKAVARENTAEGAVGFASLVGLAAESSDDPREGPRHNLIEIEFD